MEELAKRAVACKWWRWMPGMLIHDRVSNFFWRCGMAPSVWLTPYGVHADRVDLIDSRKPPVMFRRAIKTGLVLTDPATVGCLLALVREAWGVPVWAEPQSDGTWVVLKLQGLYTVPIGLRGDTESAALVAALEAAP
jgi:hypothetical protein